nr:alpha beta hydrolase [Pseudomonas sp.]
MGVFDYKNLGTEGSKALFADAMAITLYSYHNLDNGFAVGYQHNGFGLGLPATLVGALLGSTDSQGVIPGIPWNPDSEKAALEAVNKAGWTPISASTLGYGGKVDARGTFFGEKAGYTTAQVEVLGKYDGDGKLLEIGIGFRGTSGPRETLISDSIGDLVSDLLAALGPKDYAKNYAGEAFGTLLKDVAAYADSHGLTGKDVVVSGHSLGGLAVNSMADLSGNKWAGFYNDSNYVAYASPTQSSGDKVLNIGYENDPVFRALDGSSFNFSSLGAHDKPHESTTDNIVSFNDHYASTLWNVLPFSIVNVPTWLSHLPTGYGDGLTRVLESKFYDLTSRDSTIIVANLSDPARANTWVQNLNRNAEPHKGNTFIIGSDGNDLIQGGKGVDFIEGGKGNDTIRDNSGHNTFLFGGQFGQDRVIGYQSTDKLVFRDVEGSADWRDHAKVVGGDTVLSFGADSVTLVGVGLAGVGGDGISIS